MTGRILLTAACVVICCRSRTPRPTPPIEPSRYQLSTVVLEIAGETALAEVADTPPARTQGLMWRTALAPDSGMLFRFDSAEVQRFWMKNTLIPLSIAFIDSAGIITDIFEMVPHDTTTPYVSSRPILWALEMNRGWFAARGIKPGEKVRGLP